MMFDNWNPWKLRERIAYLEGRIDEISERAEDAEARAFDRAARYYQFQLERSRETERAAMAHVMQMASLTVNPAFTVPEVFGKGQDHG